MLLKRNSGFLVAAAMAACFLGWSARAEAHANWRVNGIGWGNCGAGVVAAAGGAASATAFTGFNSECCVPAGVYVPCTNWAPLPAGANGGSFAGSWYRAPWTGASRVRGVAGDGYGTTTIDPDGAPPAPAPAPAPCPDANGASSFSLSVTGSTYTLSGSWSSDNPMAIGSVCIECNGANIQCFGQSGVWAASLAASGLLCAAQPAPGQTADQWYAENVYLSVNIDAPANPKCAITKQPADGGLAP